MLTGSADGCVYMWNGDTMMGVFAGHSGPVSCGKFTPDGKKIVTAGEDGTARIWNPKDQQTLFTFTGHLWHSLVCMLLFYLLYLILSSLLPHWMSSQTIQCL